MLSQMCLYCGSLSYRVSSKKRTGRMPGLLLHLHYAENPSALACIGLGERNRTERVGLVDRSVGRIVCTRERRIGQCDIHLR